MLVLFHLLLVQSCSARANSAKHTSAKPCYRSYHHAGLLLPSLELCYSQLLSSAPEIKRSREPFLIQCMLFVLGVMRCDGYKGRTGSILTSTKDSEQASVGSSRVGQAYTCQPCCRNNRTPCSTTAVAPYQVLLLSPDMHCQVSLCVLYACP